MQTEPTTAHRWLQQFVGNWNYRTETAEAPGKPAEVFAGQENVRALGDFWILCEASGATPCIGQANTLLTLGYETQKQRFVGSWIGSMMDHFWIYDGELDDSGTALSLLSTGPRCNGSGTARYRDLLELVDANQRRLTSYIEDPEGGWLPLMTTTYVRVA